MRTPAEYTKNLKNGVISKAMLADALYSVNKRAKNWRDKKRQYRGWDPYHNFEKCEEEQNKMYGRKEKLLSVLNPLCIHLEPVYNEEKVTSEGAGFLDRLFSAVKNDSVVWWSSFIKRENRYGYYDDWEKDYYEDDDEQVVVFFKSRTLSDQYNYYLYYPYGHHSYHTPITKEEAETKYKNIDHVKIGKIVTHGDDIEILVSVQFVDKLIAIIDSGNYTLEEKNCAPIPGDEDKDSGPAIIRSEEERYRTAEAINYLKREIHDQVRTRLKRIIPNQNYELNEIEKREIRSRYIEGCKKTATSKKVFKLVKKGQLQEAKTRGLSKIDAYDYNVKSYEPDIPYLGNADFLPYVRMSSSISEAVDRIIDDHPEWKEKECKRKSSVIGKCDYIISNREDWKKEVKNWFLEYFEKQIAAS